MVRAGFFFLPPILSFSLKVFALFPSLALFRSVLRDMALRSLSPCFCHSMGKSLANQLGGGGARLLVCFERSESSVQGNNVLACGSSGGQKRAVFTFGFTLNL